MFINLTSAGSFFIMLLILVIVFLSKPGINNTETKYFKSLALTTLIGLGIEIIIYGLYAIFAEKIVSPTFLIIAKLMILYYVFFMYFFVSYTCSICFCKTKKDFSKFFIAVTVIYFIFLIAAISLDFEIVSTSEGFIPTGPAMDFSYVIGALGVSFISLSCIIKHKELKNKKAIPFIGCIIMAIISLAVQSLNENIVLLIPSHAIAVILMYFTMENPDVKMLEEFRIAKNRAEKANEEKAMFLYNITQDIRNPLSEIRKANNWLNENIKNKNVLDASYYIGKNINNVLGLVNNALDISTLEVTGIKIYNTKYNINNITTFMMKNFQQKISEKIEYRVNIDSNIPNELYGDQIRLKQVLEILIDNSIKNTKEGFIELNVNSILKKDVCRILITIEDSGSGIKPSEMEQILNKEEHLIKNNKIDEEKSTIAMAKSIVNLLGGTLLIDSELGKGTKMTIVLDQKIYDEKSLELNRIEKDVTKFIDNTKVMVVIENEEYREKVVKKLSRYDLDLEIVELGSKCLDNIRMSKKYDLIIMDESLSHLSSIEIITKLKAIPSFQTPVVLLTENTDNKGYINNGFTYLLDRKVPSKDLEAIIEKVEK